MNVTTHPDITNSYRRTLVLPRIFALLLLVTATGVAACGKKGPPIEPEDEDLTYPREYPTSL